MINTDAEVVAERQPGADAADRWGRSVLPVGGGRRGAAEPRRTSTDLGLSSFISTGDYADVTGNDVMQFWEDDEATRVCLLSLDSIGNPRKFSRITRRLTRRKPVVVLAPGPDQPGRSHVGVRGGLGHAPDDGGRRAVPAGRRDGRAPRGAHVRHRQDRRPAAAAGGPRVRLITNSATLAPQMRTPSQAVGLLQCWRAGGRCRPRGERR